MFFSCGGGGWKSGVVDTRGSFLSHDQTMDRSLYSVPHDGLPRTVNRCACIADMQVERNVISEGLDASKTWTC